MGRRNDFGVFTYVLGVKKSNETMYLVITIFGNGEIQYGG